MKDNLKDIEKLFKESFDGFESDVDPGIWDNISSKIGNTVPSQDPSSSISSSASSSGGSTGIVGLGAVKVAAIVGTAGLLFVGGYFMFSEDEKVVVENSNASETEIVLDQSEELIPIESDEQEENQEIIAKSENKIVENHQNIQSSDIDAEKPSLEPVKSESKSDQNIVNADRSNEKVAASSSVKKGDIGVASTAVVANELPNDKDDLNPEQEIAPEEIFDASIYASVSKGKQPLEVRFENNGSYSDIVLWKFRDETESNSSSAYHTFEKKGDYWVILEIRNEKGQFSKDSIKITVEGKAYIKVDENVFSPNGDNYNDEFKVEGDYIGSFSCKIYNRNNSLIFEWNWMEGYWDGRDLNGNIAPNGTYFYIIDATDIDGVQLQPIRGTVQLFR